MSRKARKIDFAERDAANRHLARLGEQFVFDLERCYSSEDSALLCADYRHLEVTHHPEADAARHEMVSVTSAAVWPLVVR